MVTKCQILNSKKSPKLEFRLPACLITFERLEAKRRNIWSLNFATITNYQWNVPFQVPQFVYPLRLVLSFILRIMVIFFT